MAYTYTYFPNLSLPNRRRRSLIATLYKCTHRVSPECEMGNVVTNSMSALNIYSDSGTIFAYVYGGADQLVHRSAPVTQSANVQI